MVFPFSFLGLFCDVSCLGYKEAEASLKVLVLSGWLGIHITFLPFFESNSNLQPYSFTDPVRRRCSVLQWNPDVATQLIVASDEDNSPYLRVFFFVWLTFAIIPVCMLVLLELTGVCIQMWDLRNIMSPVKEFSGHTKGIQIYDEQLFIILPCELTTYYLVN